MHIVLGQRVIQLRLFVASECRQPLPPFSFPLPHPTILNVAQNGVQFSKPEWWHACFTAPHTLLSLQLGGVEKRHMKWETGLG